MRSLSIFCVLALLLPATQVQGQAVDLTPPELVVMLTPAASSASFIPELEQEHQQHGGVTVVRDRVRPQGQRVLTFRFPDGTDAPAIAADYQALSVVHEAIPNWPVSLDSGPVLPNDPEYTPANSWNLDLIRAPEAWALHRGAETSTVGIIDSGVHWKHPDLVQNLWHNAGEDLDGDGVIVWNGTEYAFDPDDLNGVDDDGNGYVDDLIGWDFVYPGIGDPDVTPDPTDNGDNDPTPNSGDHGTAVAGAAVATTDNGVGIASINWHGKIAALCVTGGLNGNLDAYLEALDYAAMMGIDVVNMSFSFDGAGPESCPSAIMEAYSDGVFLVGSSGYPDYDGGYDPGDGVFRVPAACDGVFAVATVWQDDTWHYTSHAEAWVDMAMPEEAWTTRFDADLPDPYTYRKGMNTSIAAPQAAGAASLLLSVNPALTPPEIEAILDASADDLDAINPDEAGLLGAGRINLRAAIQHTLEHYGGRLPFGLTIGAGEAWAPGAVTWTFDAGQEVAIYGGSLVASGTTFEAHDAAAGWHGVRALGTASQVVLDGATISGVTFPTPVQGQPQPDRAAVEAFDANVTVTNTNVFGTQHGHGVLAHGAYAYVTLDGGSTLSNNGGYGAKAASGGTVSLEDARLETNGLGGLYASNGDIEALGGTVSDNTGPGVGSRANGIVELVRSGSGGGGGSGSRSAGGGLLSVNDNGGGLYATQSGSVASVPPLCAQPPCTFSRHDLADNALQAGDFDARSTGGSSVLSEGNYWGPGVVRQSQLAVDADAQSLVRIRPDAAPLSPGSRTAGGAREEDLAVADETGLDEELSAPFLFIADAETALVRGDAEAAHAALLGALATATTEGEQAAAYASAARVLYRADSEAVRAWLADQTVGPTRDGALAALAAAHEGAGRYAEAADAFAALSQTDAAAFDAVAFSGLVRLAVLGGDEAAALAALGELASVGELADEAAGEAAALVLAAFSGADLSELPAPEPETGPGAAVADARGRADVGLSAPVPNPTAGTSRVRYTLAEAGAARLAVYDALGRRVAVLASGDHAAGPHAAPLDGARLAPGVYVVRLTADDGTAEAVRLTVVR